MMWPFKKMAVELLDAKGSVKAAADELGIDPAGSVSGRTSTKEVAAVLYQPVI
jgi:hypothetical protein